MSRLRRLDAELVRRGLARNREHAGTLVTEGRVSVQGRTAAKPATQVDPGVAILVAQDDADPGYASRGGHKLAGALDDFAEHGLDVKGRRALDAGASTGGFTDVLLRRGVEHVVAVDVGYGQLVWALQTDDRVTVLDRINVRELTAEQVAPAPTLVVADLSFISLKLVLPALRRSLADDADHVLMVKPQFEVGKDRVGSGGVVRDPALHAEAVLSVATAAHELGLGLAGVTPSPLPGPSGNVEFFLWLRAGAPAPEQSAVEAAVARSPRAPGSR